MECSTCGIKLTDVNDYHVTHYSNVDVDGESNIYHCRLCWEVGAVTMKGEYKFLLVIVKMLSRIWWKLENEL